jgi:hypothetical protein
MEIAGLPGVTPLPRLLERMGKPRSVTPRRHRRISSQGSSNHALRVKTVWFKKHGERPAEEVATVLASNIWRLADKAVDNLSKADYDIITPSGASRSSVN